MPRGDKSKYTDKQERKADHIAEGYEKRGVSEKEAERRAWATVNKDDGGGKKAGGSGRGKHTGNPAAHKVERKGGKASVRCSTVERSASAKKAAATRKRTQNATHILDRLATAEYQALRRHPFLDAGEAALKADLLHRTSGRSRGANSNRLVPHGFNKPLYCLELT